jgi:plasmid stabilization system protein ParE
MKYSFIWHEKAEITLQDEALFILKKWNELQVEKFQDLVLENLERLSINPEIGIYNKQFNAYFLVISKQTTLYYNFDTTTKIIELYLFWNNSKNPDDLMNLL